MFKEFLMKLKRQKTERLEELKNEVEKAESVEAVRTCMSEAETLRSEIADIDSQLLNLEKKAAEFNPAEARSLTPAEPEVQPEALNPLETMEYRTAFMNYVQKGVKSPVLETRADTAGTASDLGSLGVVIPLTVQPLILQEIEKISGTLYSKVKKTNLQGGVKYPIASFAGATFKRITETTKSDRQKAGTVTGSVTFEYKIGEIRLARTLLQAVLTVPAFEAEYAKVIARCYVEAMDNEILNGDPSKNEMEGILTEAAKTGGRIPAANVIEVTEADMSDWTYWRKNVFAQIPMALESSFSEFVMAKQTLEGNLKTMKDANGQPINLVGYDANDRSYTFDGIPVNRCETTLFKSFDNATAGDYFAMLWNPEMAYAINSNLEFSTIDYFDNELNQYVKKALVINDGKVLDPNYIYLFKKAAKAS